MRLRYNEAMQPERDFLVLTGPTGSGKTGLALDLAERLGAEIVSMDSMALYRGMDIGTAKPTPAQRQRVRHHLIDVLDPWEPASVAWWLEQAQRCLKEIRGRGKQALFVGGTPLYLKALLRGLFAGPEADAAVRLRLEAEARAYGQASLHRRLAEVDPKSAARIHANDLRRVIRALEVFELTGRPISALQQQWEADSGQQAVGTGEGPPSTVLWLNPPRTELYARINQRVDEMFATGLVDEVRRLRTLPRPLAREPAQALGYKETLAFLDEQGCLADVIDLVKTRTRQFAKRQVTWFRHIPECRPATSELTWTLWQPKMMA